MATPAETVVGSAQRTPMDRFGERSGSRPGGGRPWATGPRSPLLPDGTVHVWRVDLMRVPDELTAALCSDEHARALRIAGALKRQLWSRSRAVLRDLLGRYLLVDPSSLQFAYGAHGKPGLPASSSAAISFNLSHSGHTALYAIARTATVGVDIEMAQRAFDELAIARRVFGQAAARRLSALSPVRRREAFTEAWTRHEAELKCLGVGIGHAAADEDRRPWSVALPLTGGGAAALAVEQAPRQVRCWAWAPPTRPRRLRRSSRRAFANRSARRPPRSA